MPEKERTEWMAFDTIEEELTQAALGSHALPSRAPAGSQWIELNDPDVFRKLKLRMGMV